jgi:hypothetical protein
MSNQPDVSLTKSSVDGVWLVFVDTPGVPEDSNGPIIRIWLNDEPVYENPPLGNVVLWLDDDDAVADAAADVIEDQTPPNPGV